MRKPRHAIRAGLVLPVVFILFLTSCRPQITPTSLPVVASSTSAPSPAPSLTPTPSPRSLVVCLGQEPVTLYPYGRGSTTMWTVLEAIYDGPIDQRSYSSQPVILEKLPSLKDGDAALQKVTVSAGDTVIDAQGDLAILAKGVRVNPSGCRSADCAQTYDGQSPLEMDQMTARFKLLPNLTWSDGQPLKASDSVYSFHLASDPSTPVSKYLVDRTVAYQQVDDLSVEWTGLPGYLDASYATFFWMPLPEHLWGSLKPADLLTDPAASRSPVGWGPYVVKEWTPGDHILLTKNPHYFRAAEGLPKFDALDIRFIGTNSAGNVNALLSGECDLVDQSAGLEEQLSALAQLEKAGKIKAAYAAGPEWEHLDFGIKPASYDDGYSQAAGDRPDFFGDPRMRAAVAYCLDRQSLVKNLLLGHSTVPDSFLPPEHPAHASNLPAYAYDPAKGRQLLDEIGWKDVGGGLARPRVSQGVAGVQDGTPLAVTYHTTQAALRSQVSAALKANLQQCGFQVEVKPLTPGELFAPGEQSPLFGRQFDLAEFSWQAGVRPACFLYMSSRIPTSQNHWVGENISGYADPAYDAACQTAMQVLPGDEGYLAAQAAVQEMFAKALPVIPLYLNVRAVAMRPDFCAFQFDPTARSELWNLESLDYGASSGS